jgi:ABC-type transport system involved in cytochrome c biogenesis permease subunit
MSYDLDEQGTVLLINHDPIGCKLVYAGYLLGILSFFGLLFFRTGWKAIACIGAFTASLWYAVSLYSLAMPVLRTSWLAAHVSLISISYLLLFVIAILGVVGLCFQKQRQRLFLWNRKLLYPAIFLLAAGIIVGSVWANISWGRYWGWDAKETWALITLLVYTLPLHRKYLPPLQEPSKFHLFCIIAFLLVLMTFFGVNYWLGGIHSYV